MTPPQTTPTATGVLVSASSKSLQGTILNDRIVSACQGGASAPSSSSSATHSSSSSNPSSTSSSVGAAPTGGGADCSGVAAWTAGVAYTGGETVVSGYIILSIRRTFSPELLPTVVNSGQPTTGRRVIRLAVRFSPLESCDVYSPIIRRCQW